MNFLIFKIISNTYVFFWKTKTKKYQNKLFINKVSSRILSKYNLNQQYPKETKKMSIFCQIQGNFLNCYQKPALRKNIY